VARAHVGGTVRRVMRHQEGREGASELNGALPILSALRGAHGVTVAVRLTDGQTAHIE